MRSLALQERPRAFRRYGTERLTVLGNLLGYFASTYQFYRLSLFSHLNAEGLVRDPKVRTTRRVGTGAYVIGSGSE